jgi:uncharacterized membrane protein
MTKSRLEAFSDGVIAILITIMVLELRPPVLDAHAGASFTSLGELRHVFVSYTLSFVFLAIYWNNHHHMFQAIRQVDGTVLWANMHLLFWLSLIPFGTAWMGDTGFAREPVAFYGFLLLMCALAYTILVFRLIRRHGRDSLFARAIGTDVKGKISLVLYIVGIAISWLSAAVGFAVYVFVALIWLVPDRRFERELRNAAGEPITNDK